jgi:hypothetical protein
MIISPQQISIFRDAQKDVLKQRLVELEVTEYWGVIFSPKGIASLTKQDMTGFMSYRQNHRWREISKEDITSDMPRLQAALLLLLDESVPIIERLNRLEPGRGEMAVPHLGKAKLGPILLVTHPKQYGVWNDYSERALRGMDLFPQFDSTWHLGQQYNAVNNVLVNLATEYSLTLWRLDMILEQIARKLH